VWIIWWWLVVAGEAELAVVVELVDSVLGQLSL
jgi:hypothetical protein